MKCIGVAIPVLMVLGSMKYLEHKAMNSIVGLDSLSYVTNIDADCEIDYQYSPIPTPPIEKSYGDYDENDELMALSSTEIEANIEKLEKLYVLRKMLSNRMQTDVVPEQGPGEDSDELVLASTTEPAYAVDAIIDEDPVILQKCMRSHVKLLMKESKDTIFLIVAHVQEKSGKPLEIINLILNSDGSVAVK